MSNKGSVSELRELESQAHALDKEDPIKYCQESFYYPKNTTYLAGHSLGLPSSHAIDLLHEVEKQWKELAVESWWDQQPNSAVGPWLSLEEKTKPILAEFLGANPLDVTIASGLGINLHFLLHSFYKPSAAKNRIICSSAMFPQDRWLLNQHLKLTGNESGSVHWLEPRPGEVLIRDSDIVNLLDQQGDSISLILLEAVSYVTSQAFDLKLIAEAAQKANVIFLLDLAHGAFVSPLELNNWGIDCAVGCSYKFGCSGPGGVGLLYVNERHWSNPELWRPGGWWGNSRDTQFEMGKDWHPAKGAAAWQVSTLPILSAAPFLGALELFKKATPSLVFEKCQASTSFLIDALEAINQSNSYRTLTPRENSSKAAEVAIEFEDRELAMSVKQSLRNAGVIVDYRESPFSPWPGSTHKPGIIRAGVHPLFNSFMDIYKFVSCLKLALESNASLSD